MPVAGGTCQPSPDNREKEESCKNESRYMVSLQEGKLLGIAIRERSRASMQEIERSRITTGEGVVGDWRGKPGSRQVTVLALEDWKSACQELGQELPWTVRRANLLVEGISLAGATGSVIRIGDVALEITGETDPCARMDETAPGLMAALTAHWRGGVCCRVTQEGDVTVGTQATLQPRD